MKKVVSLLLAVLMLSGFLCACHKPEEEAETVVIFSSSGKSEWTVIFSPEDHFRATGAAFSLWQTVNDRFQYYPGFGKDIWIKQSVGEKEILVGNTDRPESAQALEGFADNEYIIKFDGTKLVINAKDPYGVRYAMRTFLAENPGEIALKTDYVKKGTFEIPETVTVVDSMKRGFNVFIKGYKPEV